MDKLFYKKIQSLFGIEEELFEGFYALLEFKSVKKNDFVLQEGQVCKFIGLIQEGSMRTYYINENEEEVNFLFHFDQRIEDTVFTDYESFLLNIPSKLNIQALEDCIVSTMSQENWITLSNTNLYWQQFSKKMTEKAYLSAKKRVEDLLYYSPENRYLKLLKENPIIFQKISQRHIASYLGITPQSLSRIRKRICIN